MTEERNVWWSDCFGRPVMKGHVVAIQTGEHCGRWAVILEAFPFDPQFKVALYDGEVISVPANHCAFVRNRKGL